MVGTTSTVKLKASADTVSELIGGVKSIADGNTIVQMLLWRRDAE